MATPATRAKSIISSLKLPIHRIFCFRYPENYQATPDTTDILITEVRSVPVNYGSDHSTSMKESVAVNLYYSKTVEIDFDLMEQTILTAFENQGWTCDYSPGHTIDPSTFQVTKIFRFTHEVQRKLLTGGN